MEVMGRDNIPKKGGLILASNHISYLDPVVLGTSIDRKIYFMAKKEIFDNIGGSFILRNLNAFPVDRTKADITAFKKAITVLKEGKILGIFPEGARSSSGGLQDLKLGVLKIAQKAEVPVLPVGIIGTNKIYPPGRKLPLFSKNKIIVNYGIPLYFTRINLKDKEGQKEAIDLLSNKMKELITSK